MRNGNERELDEDGDTFGSYPTYEEWKPFIANCTVVSMMEFLSYL